MNEDLENELKRWLEGPIYRKSTGERLEGPFELRFSYEAEIRFRDMTYSIGLFNEFTLEKPLDRDTLEWVLRNSEEIYKYNREGNDYEALLRLVRKELEKLEGESGE